MEDIFTDSLAAWGGLRYYLMRWSFKAWPDSASPWASLILDERRLTLTGGKKCPKVWFYTRWWFQIFLIIHPYLGKIPNLTNIFQIKKKHQPVYFRVLLQLEPSLSMRQAARSLWSTVACRWIPSSPFKTSMLWTGPAKPLPRYERYPTIIYDYHSWTW